MTYANDWRKIVLVEIQPGRELNASVWTKMAGNGYYLALANNEITNVMVNGISLVKTTTALLVDTTAGTWWHDFLNQILYVHLTAETDPGEHIDGPPIVYANSVIIFFWLGFVNAQYPGLDCIDFIPVDCTYPIYWEPWLNENSIAALSAVISSNFESSMEVQFGSLSFINNGWWYQYRHLYLWNNKNVRVRVGSLGDAYATFETIFIGKCRSPKIADESATFELVDTRIGSLYSLPTTRYDLATYPDMSSDSVDMPIPILFGEKLNITPICISTVTFTYKVSNTIFNGVSFPLANIMDVYKSGVNLIYGTDYTVDLVAGTFTLLATPGDEGITCDAKGICDGYDMITGLATGLYSENVANHLFFIFTVLNNIPVANMDLTSFWELQNARTQAIALYLDTDTETMDVNRLFQQSSIYNFLPLIDGSFAAKYYRRIVPAGTMKLFNYDYDNFNSIDQSENVYYGVVVKYDKDPTTGLFKTVSVFTDSVKWQHDEKQLFEVETALRNTLEAVAVRDFYAILLNAPADKIETNISLEGKNLLPTDKLIITRTVESDLGHIVVLTDQVYIILETHKDLIGGKVGIVAQLDSQLAISSIHADLDYNDSHSNSTYSDHLDDPYNDHTDSIAHINQYHIDHNDVRHLDVPYADGTYPYEDHLDDQWHQDHGGGYLDKPHVDETHNTLIDLAHSNVAHTDEPHEDGGHGNHNDNPYTDLHTDVAHIDSVL